MKNDAALARFIVLSGYSDIHENYSIKDMHRLYLPPIALGQYRIWEFGEKPLGFITWAFFSAEAEQAYLTVSRKLQAEDWNSGDIPYVIDFVGPFGSVMQMVKEARAHLRDQYGAKKLFKGWRRFRGKQCQVTT